MPDTLADLQRQRSELVARFARLGDLRPGSVTGIVRRCGKPTCHCAQPDDPGHGPTLRLTYKAEGKTISEALPTPAAVRKAEQEIAEFRKFQELSRSFVDVNEKGTEAAAATAVVMRATAAMVEMVPFTPVFRADRPFLYLIRDVETDCMLFVGRMTKP